MPILPLKYPFQAVISAFLQTQTLRNNAQISQRLYCALLRNMVCYISKLPVMETIPVLSCGCNIIQIERLLRLP